MKRKWHWRWWVGSSLISLAVLMVAFYAEEDWRGKRAWDKFEREWEAKGETFDFARFVPPPVPDDQNFALTPIVAGCYLRWMDKNGHQIEPENTNIVNRLALELGRHRVLDGHPALAGSGWSLASMSDSMVTNKWETGGLTDLKAWQSYYRARFITNGTAGEVEELATNEFPVATEPQTPAADVLLALSKFDSVIKELRQASHRPFSRFPIDYDNPDPSEIRRPHLTPLYSCVRVLKMRACAELAASQQQQALSDIKLMLRLAESIHSEPFQASLDTRRRMVALIMQPIWEGLVQHRWTDDQLSELDGELARLDFLADIYHAVRAECAANLKVIDYCRVTHNANIVPFGYEPEDYDFRTRLDSMYYRSFPEGWYYLGKVAYARVSVWSVFSAVDLRRRTVSSEYYGMYTVDGRRFCGFDEMKAPWFFYVPVLFPDVKTGNYARMQTGVDCARVAIALERFHLVHGEYPEMLETVTPLFPGPIPHDVINGQPLHYHRTADGNFLLYSVGWDRHDNGGVPTKYSPYENSNQRETGDWVWLGRNLTLYRPIQGQPEPKTGIIQ